MRLTNALKIQSHRAEIVLLEAARARTAADGGAKVNEEDIIATTPLALCQRSSDFMERFVRDSHEENVVIASAGEEILGQEKR